MKRYHLGILSLGLGMMLASCNSGSGDKGILSGVSDMFDSGLSEESLQKALQSGASLDSTVYKRAGVIQSV